MPIPHQELLARVADVDALVASLSDRIDAAVLDAAPMLRVVSIMAVGYDSIDVAATYSRPVNSSEK